MHFQWFNEFWIGGVIALTVGLLGMLWRDHRDMNNLGKNHFDFNVSRVFIRRVVRNGFVFLALVFMVLGVMGLEGKPEAQQLFSRGIDVMMVLDVSKSMLTQDVKPNRLEAAKKTLMTWLSNVIGDRVGLVIFSGAALTQVPLTLDLNVVKLVLSRAAPDEIDRGGTDIGDGIRMALSDFQSSNPKRGKAIILVSDGGRTPGTSSVQAAVRQAVQDHVSILTVGVGTQYGGPIPDGYSFWGHPRYMKNPNGTIHISRLHPRLLEKIAKDSKGISVFESQADAFNRVDHALDRLPQTLWKQKSSMEVRKNLSPQMAMWSAGCLVMASIL
jgi:Ca-activated chloride channel family protein